MSNDLTHFNDIGIVNLKQNPIINETHLCSFQEDMVNNMDTQIGPHLLEIPHFNACFLTNLK